MHSRRGGRSRQRRDADRGAGVLQRARRRGGRSGRSAGSGRSGATAEARRPVGVLQADAAAGGADAVAGVRPRDRAVRVPRGRGHGLRRVVRQTGATVRDGPVEVRERHAGRPRVRRIRRRRRRAVRHAAPTR